MSPTEIDPIPAQAEAAVAIVHAAAQAESVLLIRRTSRADDPWSGHWSFPGGRCEPGDEDLLGTALRELAEECGLLLQRSACREALPLTHAGRHSGRLMMVAPFVFGLDTEREIRLDPNEAETAMWLPLAVVRDPARHQIHTGRGIPDGRRVPGILLDGVVLWGFTYRVLCDWLGLVAPEPG